MELAWGEVQCMDGVHARPSIEKIHFGRLSLPRPFPSASESSISNLQRRIEHARAEVLEDSQRLGVKYFTQAGLAG
jgi:hypothetical protein